MSEPLRQLSAESVVVRLDDWRRATIITPRSQSMSGAVAIMTGAAAPSPPTRDPSPRRRPPASLLLGARDAHESSRGVDDG
jgi:hypothetical protein